MPRILLHHEAAEAAAASDEFELDYETAKKMTRVLRMNEGETFVGFDGHGSEWDCAIGFHARRRQAALCARDIIE